VIAQFTEKNRMRLAAIHERLRQRQPGESHKLTVEEIDFIMQHAAAGFELRNSMVKPLASIARRLRQMADSIDDPEGS